MSVSIYVPLSPSPVDVLTSLQSLYTTNPLLSTYLDVHLVISPNPRQFNLQRNQARFFARTEFVMMLDVDFAIRTTFRDRVRGQGGDELRQLLRGGQAALVLPAFEYADQADGTDPSTFPDDKEVSPSIRSLCKERLAPSDVSSLTLSGTTSARRGWQDWLVPQLLAPRSLE